MKKCFIYVIAAISALVVSCNKEIDTPDNNTVKVDQNLVSMTFKAALEGDDTKTTLNTSDGKVAWAAGDAVKFVWEVNGTSGVDSSVSTALTAGDIDGDGAASFNASVHETFSKATDASVTSRHLYAVYPSSVVVDYSTASSFYLTVPTTQDGSFKNASIALAKWNKDAPAANLDFKNLCGLLQIEIDDPNVRKIVLHSDDYIAGKMDISFTGPSVKGVNSGENDITVNVSGAGTYYVAVLPTDSAKGIGVTNMYVELFDDSDNLIGDRFANNAIPVARKQIRKLGTIATVLDDKLLFFTPSGNGSKNGSSWGDAGDVELLKTTMKSAVTKNLFLAKGNYNLGNSACTAASNLKLYGGFPESPSGRALSGRDVISNITKLYNDDKSRIFYISNASSNWVFDGLTFLCTNYNGEKGGAFSLLNGTAVLNNCTFDSCSNTKTGTYGGVVRIDASGTATFTRCVFSNNTASAHGGVFFNAGTVTVKNCTFTDNTAANYGGAIYNSGTFTAEKCVFTDNTAANGGAMFITTTGTAYLRDVTFTNNKATTNGSAIYGQGGTSGGATLFMDGCYFSFTDSNKIGASYAVAMNHANTTLGMNNCVVTGGWGSTAKGQLLNLGTGVIVNSNFFQQSASPDITVGSAGTLLVANSVVVNAGSSGNGKSFTNNGTLSLDHTLWNIMSAGTVTNASGNLAGVKVGSSGNFPNVIGTYKAWYNTDFNTMYGNDQTETASVSDCRSSVHYYKWNGVIPDSITDYSTFDMSSYLGSYLSGLVNTANSSFRTWIGDNLYVDIRGNARNTAAMWPGSYEE